MVLEDSSTTNIHSLSRSICLDVVVVWEVVLDVEEEASPELQIKKIKRSKDWLVGCLGFMAYQPF